MCVRVSLSVSLCVCVCVFVYTCVCACLYMGVGVFCFKNKVTYQNMNLINRTDHLWTETAGFSFFSGIG